MQSYAEGYELLAAGRPGRQRHRGLALLARGHGDPLLAARPAGGALDEDAGLDQIAGYAEDSGEGRWTVEAAIDNAVPHACDHRGAVHPVRVAPGRVAGDEGGGRHAQPVRRARRTRRRAPRRHPAYERPEQQVHVSHLSLIDFRSYATVEVALEAGVTAFVGPNGQGKTNLVEAIDYVATQASHRVATDQPLVRLGASGPSCGPRSARATAPRWSSSRSTLARRTGPGSTGAPTPGRGRSLGHPAHRAVRAGGPGAGQGGPGRAAAVPRRPAGRPRAAVRRCPCGL